MKRTLFAALAMVAMSACAAKGAAVVPGDFYGTWKIARINAYGVVTQSEARMNALLGKPLVLAADKVILADEPPCRPPGAVSVEEVDTSSEVPAKAAGSPAEAGLPARAPMLYTGCLSVFMVGDHLVFGARGAWYTAERTDRKP